MADVSANLKDWSTTAASNSPTDSTTVGSGLADNLQEIQKVVRQDLAYKGADIASAGTTDIGAVAGSYHDITGTTTITSLGTVSAGIWKTLQFDGALTLTHNATSLILPGGGNITTAAGDHLRAVSLGSGNWVVTDYTKASGQPVTVPYEHRNAIDNADFQIWQRGASITLSTVNTMSADRWAGITFGGGTANILRSTTVPTVAQAGRVIPYSLQYDVTAADTSIGASEVYYIQHAIEGYRWAHFAQQTLTLSFWVRSTVTGTYCIALTNGVDRTWLQQYTISASDTWEFKTLTITASPSAGTWDYTTGGGLYCHFTIAAGSSFHGTNATWNSSASLYATSSQVNGVSSTSNNFYLAGVQLERGSAATPFAAIPFDMDLQRCQRYYQKSFPYATAPAQNTGSTAGALRWIVIQSGTGAGNSHTISLATRMRTSPTATLYNPSAANAQIRNTSSSADWSSSSGTASETTLYVNGQQDAGASIGHASAVHWALSAEL